MDKKFELIMESAIDHGGETLYAIRALRDFGLVMKGDIGGFVEKEENLSHDGKCWISRDSVVKGDAIVSDNAKVNNYSIIKNNARVSGNAVINNFVTVADDAHVSGNSKICDGAQIFHNAIIDGDVKIRGPVHIGENATIRNQNDFIAILNVGNDRKDFSFYRISSDSIGICIYDRPKNETYTNNIDAFERLVNDQTDEDARNMLSNILEMAKLQINHEKG